jgi:medium-chain acyl-[acyl-carrier-protein] hydrolase
MASDWLLCAKERPKPLVRMVCAAHAGGAASMFAKWHSHLPQAIEVWAVQLPGREERLADPPVGSLAAVVAAIGPDVAALGRNTELVLFGNCLGALVMYELARWLRRQGAKEPRLLVVAAHPAPPLIEPPPDPPIHQLPDQEVLREVGKFAVTDQKLFFSNPELQELLLPVFRSDAQVHETYQYRLEEPLNCNILAIGGRDDVDVPEDALYGWSAETYGSFTMRMFAGGHLFMLTQYTELMPIIRELLFA